MKISLSPEVERLIAEKLRTGRFRSADEIVREGLELLEEREQTHPAGSNSPSNFVAAFEAIAKEVPSSEWTKLPSDFSKNLDHYLYGGPKTP